MAGLYEGLQIRGVHLKNRIVMSPMCQYSAEEGLPNDWHFVHLGSRAVGGAGLIIVEATAVTPEGRITPGDLGIWNDEQVEAFKRITNFIHAQGSVAGIQLAHAGRKASHDIPWKGGEALTTSDAWETLAPSAIAFKDGEPTPKEMTEEDIRECIDAFRAAAERALAAGFKVVEIHGAHGYLIHEFLSPLSNKRRDQYGGSFENRIRFLIEITEAVRSVWPEELPLFVRLSATDWVVEGWNDDDTVRLASILGGNGVDLIDCSTGGNTTGVKIPLVPLYQVPFAERVKKETKLLAGAVGLINTAEECEQVIREGRADLVFLARALLRNPYFPLQAAMELGEEIQWPDQYLRAKRH